MFVLATFLLNNLSIKLVFPETSHAQSLYNLIEQDRSELSRFLPWANEINALQDELAFIKLMRSETAEYKKLALVILVNNQPAGMVDLHDIKLKHQSAEIGYWLGQKYQGKGIMTESVKRLVQISFSNLSLHRLNLLADHRNKASRAIAQRLKFDHVALLKDEVKYHGQFCDMDLYTVINSTN